MFFKNRVMGKSLVDDMKENTKDDKNINKNTLETVNSFQKMKKALEKSTKTNKKE